MTAVLMPPKVKVLQQSPALFRLSVEQYQRMVQTGILGKYDRCELIGGLLVAKMSRNPPHDGTLHKLCIKLGQFHASGWQARDQKALVLDDSVPEPDIVVARGDEDSYDERHPTASDTALVVEVAESSLSEDRKRATIYARNGIPVYWIVNLVDFTIEVYTQPTETDYESREDFTRGNTVSVVLDGKIMTTLDVASILPKAG